MTSDVTLAGPAEAPTPLYLLLAAALVLCPFIASYFFITQIGASSMIYGMIALSLMLLAGYGGMVSPAEIDADRDAQEIYLGGKHG